MKLSIRENLKSIVRRQGTISMLEARANRAGYVVYHHENPSVKPDKVVVELFGPGGHTISAGGKSMVKALSRAIDKMNAFLGDSKELKL